MNWRGPSVVLQFSLQYGSCYEVWDVRMCEAGRSACVLIVFHVEGGRFSVLVHVCIYMWLEDVMLERSAHGAIPWL